MTVGQRYARRKKLFCAILDTVEVKTCGELSPRDIQRENPEMRTKEEVMGLLSKIYGRDVTDGRHRHGHLLLACGRVRAVDRTCLTKITIIGGGLAGSEAAWQAANAGREGAAVSRCGRSSRRRCIRPTNWPNWSAPTRSSPIC